MNTTKSFALIILSCFVFLTISCSKNDDDTTTTLNPNPVQPTASDFEIDKGRVIGFWDFNQNGVNEVKNQAKDWELENAIYDDGNLVLSDNSINTSNFYSNTVEIANSNWPSNQGLNKKNFFSGAVKFKIEKSDANFPILTFGTSVRFLRLRITNGKIDVRAAEEFPQDAINTLTDFNVEVNKWNVLYFRYEDFTANNSSPQNGNKFYVQLNNEDEFEIDFGSTLLNNIQTTTVDNRLCFKDIGKAEIFNGKIDWVLLSNGRMTPGNAQHRLVELKLN